MFINTEKKYSPKSLNDFVFPNKDSKDLVLAYASGEIERPLILHGTSGTGKSVLQRLIPNAIEKSDAVVNRVKCADIKNASDIHNLYGRNKHFQRNFKVNDQKFNYFIIGEFLMTNKRLSDALKIELDDTLGIDMTILSTNRFNEIDDGIISRCEVLELHACEPNIFFPHAKQIFVNEGVNIDDNTLMKCLDVTYIVHKDNRKYYQAIDNIFRSL